jgi:hypothetical protein
MKRVKVKITNEVDAIEVYGVVFSKRFNNGAAYEKGEIRLIDNSVVRSGSHSWIVEFPGGAFKGETPEECLSKLTELWAELGTICSPEMLPVEEPAPEVTDTEL